MTDEERRVLSSRSAAEPAEPSPRVLVVGSEDAELVFDALSSTTARRIFAELYERPAPPSVLADMLDLSLQNVHYHLENLRDADLVGDVATTYSTKGVEMSVYAPVADPVVISGRSPDETRQLRSVLEQVVGGIALLGVLAVVVRWVVARASTPTTGPGTPVPGPAPAWPGIDTPALLGVVFFLGGATILLLALCRWFYRAHIRGYDAVAR